VPGLALAPPSTAVEPVTEVLHGVAITDPYRWLEDQDSPQTRHWIEEQTRYGRSYLDLIPGREKIRERIREFLAVETYDSLERAGSRYFFRKRLPDEEQPCVYMREEADGQDQLLIDPAERGTGKYTAVKPLRASQDGRLLLYEVKQGGERTGTFELLDVESRTTLSDILPRGYLRGFAFAPDGKSFCYVHERADAKGPHRRAACRHVLGSDFEDDREIFFAGWGEKMRLCLVSDVKNIGFLVYRFLSKTLTDFYLKPWEGDAALEHLVKDAEYSFGPLLLPDRILAITDRNAPNLRIVELRRRPARDPEWVDLVPESEGRIEQWAVARDRIVVSYIRRARIEILVFDLAGKPVGEIPVGAGETVRIRGASPENDELFLESESFTAPVRIHRYSPREGKRILWAKKTVPFDSTNFRHIRVRFRSKDGTEIPMFLVGRRDVLLGGCHPAIMTSYGGYGVSMTPKFSVFVAFLMEKGCLFALPNIRGGAEFGAEWHKAARRQNRQTAYDDFLSAAEWLVQTGRTSADRLAIFGGSNSGLLVGAALTQRPELFRAAVCMVPILDMLRYHLFDNLGVWTEEFGSADNPDEFSVLRKYSPYHRVRDGVAYPATMIVSGDADRNCNPLHARKMTARLQAANRSPNPIFLDYSKFRGHSPVLPLSERIEALTDRMAFLSDQLQLPV